MKNISRNVLAVIAGWIVGAALNMGLIIVGSMLIPTIEGMDPMNAHGWPLKFFIFPFLAHSFGTLVGAFLAAKIALNYRLICSMLIGVFFLFGGIMMVRILPAPLWFVCLDLVFAYLPMGWLGWKWSANQT